jgi:hypothetical protein
MRPTIRPAPLSLAHQNASEYTLHNVGDHTPINTPTTPSYGSTAGTHRPSSRRLIFNATLKMVCIFLASTLLLGSILWLALPTLEESVSSPL